MSEPWFINDDEAREAWLAMTPEEQAESQRLMEAMAERIEAKVFGGVRQRWEAMMRFEDLFESPVKKPPNDRRP